jgi:signal transduction histidine kinase/tetratricopeptide (TPR) repeat protein
MDSLLNVFVASDEPETINIFALTYHETENIPPAVTDSLLLPKINRLTRNSYKIIELYRLRAYALYFHKHNAESISIARQAYDMSKMIDHEKAQAVCAFDLGFYYRELRFLLYAAQYLREAAVIYSNLKNTVWTARCFYELALTSYEAGNYNEALEEQKQSLRHYYKIDKDALTGEDHFFIMSGTNTMGLAYKKTFKYDSALIYFNKADSLARKNNSVFWVGLVGGNKGEVYFLMNKVKEALPLFKADYAGMKGSPYPILDMSAALNLAEAYIRLDMTDSAFALLKDTEDLREHVNTNVNQRYWKVMAMAQQKKKDFRGAAQSLQRVISLQDTARISNEATNLSHLKTIYELESKNESIRQLSNDILVQQNRIQRQTLVIIASTVILGLLVMLSMSFYRFTKKSKSQLKIIEEQKDEILKQNSRLETQSYSLKEINRHAEGLNIRLEERVKERTAKLEEALTQLNTYLYRSSHDLRRPLTTLMGLSQLFRSGLLDLDELVKMMDKTTYMLDGMLKKMQMAHDLDYIHPKMEIVNVNGLISRISKQLLADEENSEVELKLDTKNNHDATVQAAARYVEIVLYNILENAIIFSAARGEDPRTVVQVNESKDTVTISVIDNGIGINETSLKLMFNQYYRGTEKSRGGGLGLFLVKKAIDKLGGAIHVESTPHVGTKIVITIPKSMKPVS